MGDDFSCLLGYRGIDIDVERMVSQLDSGYEPPQITRVVDFGAAAGFAFAERSCRVGWHEWKAYDVPLPARPQLPDLEFRLGLQSAFELTFGQDAIWIHHLLRWSFFTDEPQWRDAMLPAVNWFREAFGATDAIITCDNSHLVCEFLAGKPLQRALELATSEGEIQITNPADLCWTEDEPSELAMSDGAGGWAPIYARHNRGWWRPPHST